MQYLLKIILFNFSHIFRDVFHVYTRMIANCESFGNTRKFINSSVILRKKLKSVQTLSLQLMDYAVSIAQRDILRTYSMYGTAYNRTLCTYTQLSSYTRTSTQNTYSKCCKKFYRVKTKRANFNSKY